MKKYLVVVLTAAFIGAAVPAFADGMWVAGSIGYENTNSKTKTDTGNSSNTAWSADPEVGYVFNKKWSGGIVAMYSSKQNATEYAGFNFARDNVRTIGAAPFVKYKFLIIGNFTAFIKGKIFYNNTKVDSQNISINSYGVSILPVIDYKLTDTWSACAALNFASIGYMYSTSDQSGSPSSDEFGLRTGNGSLFNVGLVYHF